MMTDTNGTPTPENPKQELVRRVNRVRMPAVLDRMMEALTSGVDLARVEKMMDLYERYDAIEARKAFNDSIAECRSIAMVLYKTKYVDIPNGAKFFHAELGPICEIIIPNLSKFGLRHQWIPDQNRPDKLIGVTCRISHAQGHFEDTTLAGGPDVGGNKSAIHAVASTVTLLERYTLLAAMGLAARHQDTNGRVPTEQPDAPDDYDRWKADAVAIADEGVSRLHTLWENTPEDIRRYVVIHDKPWWLDQKARAEKVTQKAEGK